MKIKLTMVFIGCLSVLAQQVQAKQFYKWVDDKGVTHYSEALPDQDIDHVALELSEDYSVSNSQDDYYSIQNQLKRLQQRRSQQLVEKQQAAQVREAKQQASEIIYVQVEEPERHYYPPVYYPRYNSHHYRKDHRPYPKHGYQKFQKPYIEKSRSGISQKVKANHSGAVFSASR
jgi:hypothetical protein